MSAARQAPKRARRAAENARELLETAHKGFEEVERSESLERSHRGRPTGRVIVSVYYAEQMRETVEFALRKLEAADANGAVETLSRLVSNLPNILLDAVEGVFSREERDRGKALAAQQRRRELATLWKEVHKEEASADPADWSRAGGSRLTAIERVCAKAKVDPELRLAVFGPVKRLPSPQSVARRLQRDAKRQS